MSESTSKIAPVVFMIFNRPDVTARVFAEIRRAQPRKLLIIADGPRNEMEAARCFATRAIVETIDWECEVLRNYSDTNLGCKKRLSSGITWVFTQTDEAIFLEDDCLPDPTFFRFCTEMLEKHRNDSRVMHISGDNFQQRNPSYYLTDSYYFSRVPHVWGWASWRRAWDLYDVDVKKFLEARDSKALSAALPDQDVRLHWEHTFAQYHSGTISSWDGQWVFCCMLNKGLCIMPNVNLISNIGFGKDATHGTDAQSRFANIPTEPISFPLIHPSVIEVNKALDAYTFKYIYGVNLRMHQKAISYTRKYFPTLYATARAAYRSVRPRRTAKKI